MTALSILTLVHVAISLVAIGSGFVVLFGLIAGKHLRGWSVLFLATTVATSVTGFFFPITRFTPGLAFGLISLLVLTPTIYALRVRDLAGAWRPIYVLGSVVSFYLNFFVLIVQSFQKVPFLKALAPTQSEPPFAFAQLAALIAFIVMGFLAMRGSRRRSVSAA